MERKILLTSGLIELGEEQERAHRELGAAAAGVFETVLFLDPKNARMFEEGYGTSVSLISPSTAKIDAGSLLVCVGRMKQSTIERLLP
jgi:UDP-N-acetylmuramyl pentapeptide synthase